MPPFRSHFTVFFGIAPNISYHIVKQQGNTNAKKSKLQLQRKDMCEENEISAARSLKNTEKESFDHVTLTSTGPSKVT